MSWPLIESDLGMIYFDNQFCSTICPRTNLFWSNFLQMYKTFYEDGFLQDNKGQNSSWSRQNLYAIHWYYWGRPPKETLCLSIGRHHLESRYANHHLEPKIKRIYKYHLVTAEPKVTNNDKKKKKVVRSLKKDEKVEWSVCNDYREWRIVQAEIICLILVVSSWLIICWCSWFVWPCRVLLTCCLRRFRRRWGLGFSWCLLVYVCLWVALLLLRTWSRFCVDWLVVCRDRCVWWLWPFWFRWCCPFNLFWLLLRRRLPLRYWREPFQLTIIMSNQRFLSFLIQESAKKGLLTAFWLMYDNSRSNVPFGNYKHCF